MTKKEEMAVPNKSDPVVRKPPYNGPGFPHQLWKKVKSFFFFLFLFILGWICLLVGGTILAFEDACKRGDAAILDNSKISFMWKCDKQRTTIMPPTNKVPTHLEF